MMSFLEFKKYNEPIHFNIGLKHNYQIKYQEDYNKYKSGNLDRLKSKSNNKK
jgi:hypothetical protein